MAKEHIKSDKLRISTANDEKATILYDITYHLKSHMSFFMLMYVIRKICVLTILT